MHVLCKLGRLMIRDDQIANFQRGVIALVVLALLRQKDMYGYELVQAMTARSGGKLVTQEGSLYPVLYKLEDAGFVSGRRVLVGKRMTRIYYHLEPEGIQHLEKLEAEYRAVTGGVFRILESKEDT